MKRLTVWACRSDAEELSKELIRLRCVDTKIDPLDAEEVSGYDVSERIREFKRKLDRISDAIEPLYQYSKRKKSLGKQKIRTDLEKFIRSGGVASAQQKVDKIIAIKERLTDLEREQAELTARVRALEPWREYGMPVNFTGTHHTRVVIGSLPGTVDDGVLDAALGGIAAAYSPIHVSGAVRQMCFIVTGSDAGEMVRRLGLCGFVRAEFAGTEGNGTAKELINECSRRLEQIQKDREMCREELRELAGALDELEMYWDVVGTGLAEAHMRERLAATKECVVLRGWIPFDKAEKTVDVLERIDCAYELSDPAEEDDVPVKLENNAFARSFEWILGMYSLPAYGSFDPTFIMGIWYIIFFSMMLADVGYGILLVLGGFLLPKLNKFSDSATRAFNMFGFCGIGSIITGIMFGGYFGDLPLAIIRAYHPGAEIPGDLALVVDPVLEPMTYLILGLILGFLHLVAGQAVNFIILWKNHKRIDAVLDIGFFWVLYVGLFLLFAAPSVGKWVSIASIVAIILTGGRREKNVFKKLSKGVLSLYGLVNFGSDIISYSRILAIALSGTILAQVFNILATMSTAPFFTVAVTPLILIVGHVLNLALSALGGFVHTSRLQYVEFFGKFYESGGRPYAPMLPSERFVTGITEKQKF